jgi:hypothetical protein
LFAAARSGAIASLPIAFGAYFWGDRLLPVFMPNTMPISMSITMPAGMTGSVAAEALCFFAAWGSAAALAQISPTRRMWQMQLGTGALLLAGIPVLNALTATSHLGASLFGAPGLGAVAGVDLVTLTLGLLLGAAAWSLRASSTPGASAAGLAKLVKPAKSLQCNRADQLMTGEAR